VKKEIFNRAFIWFSMLVISCNQAASPGASVETNGETIEDFSEEQMSPEEYAGWEREKSDYLRKNKDNKNLKTSLTFRTPEKAALIGLQGEQPSRELWDTLLREYSAFTQFEWKVQSAGVNDEFFKMDNPQPEVYEERVKYYSFGIQNDIKAVVNKKDTLDCTFLHFERSFGVSPVSKFLIGFPAIAKGDDVIIIIKDRIFSETPLIYEFSAGELRNVPQLKLF